MRWKSGPGWQADYPALGVAYGIIGALIVPMAVSYHPDTAVGLDAALTTLAAQTHGIALLLLAAAGLAGFGGALPVRRPLPPRLRCPTWLFRGAGRRRVHRRFAGVR